MQHLKGVGVANGIAIGKALVILDEETVTIEEHIEVASLDQERKRFLDALSAAKQQLRDIKNSVQEKIGEEHAFIFETHILLLDDSSLRNETLKFIEEHECNAEFAFSQILVNLLKEFSSLGDSYFVERGNDLKDVGKRVLHNLMGGKKAEFGFKNLSTDVIVIGAEFGPSNITHFDHPHIMGFASDFGGQTTHTAIIAKALGLPAVVGLHDITKRVKSGDMVIIDSFSGKVFIDPSDKILKKYQRLNLLYQEEAASYMKDINEPAMTCDGIEVELLANIELPGEVAGAIKNGARGIGLYRTEFLFLECDPELPSEAVHYQTYCRIAKDLGENMLTIRTLDLGGEKFFNRQFVREKEINPVMGLRGIRLCLKRTDIFKTQLRAILRTMNEYDNVRMMFPLICSLEEWYATTAFLEEVKDELRAEGVPFKEKPELGVMIEVPSAAMIADLLAKEVSFFSIGTNDLIQYFLAIDRANDDVSYLYDPLHPGVVRMLHSIIEAANRHKIDVSCCGEMASQPLFAIMLIHLGLRKLSMNPSSLPIIHHVIREMDFKKFADIIADPLQSRTGEANLKAIKLALKQVLNDHDYQHLVLEKLDEET